MSGKLLVVTSAERFGYGEYWRVKATPDGPPPAALLGVIVTSRSGLSLHVPVSEYKVAGPEVEFCVEYDLPGEEADYVGAVMLSNEFFTPYWW